MMFNTHLVREGDGYLYVCVFAYLTVRCVYVYIVFLREGCYLVYCNEVRHRKWN